MIDLFKKVKFTQLTERHFPYDYVNHIINGDCVEVMSTIPANSIDLAITSPPYFVKKDYEKDWSFDHYQTLMSSVFRELYRILKPGKYVVVNFGDYFNGNRFYKADVPSVYPATITHFQWGRSVGFDLQSTRIWRKQFARMGIPMVCNDHPRPVFDYEHVWAWRKPDGTGKEFVNDRKKSQRGVIGEKWKSSAKISSHEAAFPIELPMWAIDVYSQNDTDVVLDPFVGIGTTMLACQMRQRNYIGIELNPDHCKKAYFRAQGAVIKCKKKNRS
jgi:site-specific DNA-methyltransferase (adenine-specific)